MASERPPKPVHTVTHYKRAHFHTKNKESFEENCELCTKSTCRRHGRHDLSYTNSCRRPRRSRNKPKTTPRRHGRHKNIIILKCNTEKCRPQAPCIILCCCLSGTEGGQPPRDRGHCKGGAGVVGSACRIAKGSKLQLKGTILIIGAWSTGLIA